MISYGIKNLDRTFFQFVAIHAFDGRTDSFVVASPRYDTGIPCRLYRVKTTERAW